MCMSATSLPRETLSKMVFLCFGIVLREPRGLYKGHIKAILGKPFRGTTLGYNPVSLDDSGFRDSGFRVRV